MADPQADPTTHETDLAVASAELAVERTGHERRGEQMKTAAVWILAIVAAAAAGPALALGIGGTYHVVNAVFWYVARFVFG